MVRRRPRIGRLLRGLWFAGCFLSAMAPAWAAPDAGPRVTTASGIVEGRMEEGLAVFRGMPYAASPEGALRWRPPQPVVPWDGVRDAGEFGPWCPQQLKPNYSEGLLDPQFMSEDCLRLNIWSPDTEPEAALPVMVWINPGSFRQGSAQLPRYDGAALARQGVVLVTFDYRIGLLGQFGHPALSAAQTDEPLANYGLMDQLALLRWVQDNIAAFGGDPGRVTVFGMSAGGVSINYLMTMPAAAGLFHGAISQSSGIRVSVPRRLAAHVGQTRSLESTGERLAAHFRLDEGDAAAGLRALSVDQLLAFQADPALLAPGSLNPVLDGVLVTEPVGQVFREGRQHAVPYLAGATSWEGSLVTFLPGPEPLFPVFGLNAERADGLYPGLDAAQRVNAIETDFFYGSQRYLAARHAATGHPAWLYFFDRVLSAHEGELPGAAHGAETRYLFGTLDSLAETPQPGYGTVVGAADRAYAARLSALWVAFARDGRPPAQSAWPRATEVDPPVMIFGQDTMRAERGFRLERLQHFDRLFDENQL